MTLRHLVLILSFVALAPALAAQVPPPHSYTPPDGFVPDSATAVAIAVAVWTPIYGASRIASERPYSATLEDGIWTVLGSLPEAPPGYATVGGVALAEISKADGRILRISHGR
jgi:hypothetical protein